MELSDLEFSVLKKMLYDGAGIRMGPEKKALVTGRLAKRISSLGLQSFGEYFRRLQISPRQGGEWQTALDLLTTNETSFFREPGHFEFLGGTLLARVDAGRIFRVWSAACSSGEEPYSLAMVLADHLGERWELVASDISQRVLDHARKGIYDLDRASQMRRYYLRKFCLRGTGEQAGRFIIDAALRNRIRFMQINLNAPLPAIGPFDLIVLRNVMIYFDAQTKRSVVARLVEHLKPGGHFFPGHSESIAGLHPALEPIQPAVYRKVP